MKIKTLLRLKQMGVLLVPLSGCADDMIGATADGTSSESGTADTETGESGGDGDGDGDGDPGDGDGDSGDGDGDGDGDAGDGDGDQPCSDGETQSCYTGLLFTEGVGTCAPGLATCEAGVWGECVGEVNPIIELCNNLDDDCNGFIDNGNPEGGVACATGELGECAKGTETCTDGLVVCSGPNPGTETCNNLLDENCNGQVDEVCSCPYIYAYDGRAWQYETSVGGASLIGRERHLRPGNGKHVRFAPLWARLDAARVLADRSVQVEILAAEDEIVYLDHAQLTAVQHPAGHEVVSSSAMQWSALKQQDPRKFWSFPTAECRTPLRASWCDELDQREALGQLTGTPAAYALDRDNSYELDFGRAAGNHASEGKRVWLLIDGWKFKRERGLARHLRGRRPELEVRQADGSWRHVKTLASPRGDRKTVAVDLSDVSWPSGNYELRLWTGTYEGGHAMWYLDRVRLVEAEPAPVSITKIAAARAQLEFRGAPTMLASDDQPRVSRNDGRGVLGELQTFGRFTRYGDVTELVRTPDDRMVVMRQGDVVSLRFEDVPDAPPGSETTLFLATNLVYKPRIVAGAKAATELTENVAPLPRRGMGRYHAGSISHDSVAYLEYLARWNTREYSRTPAHYLAAA
jgi:hypothetical protein